MKTPTNMQALIAGLIEEKDAEMATVVAEKERRHQSEHDRLSNLESWAARLQDEAVGHLRSAGITVEPVSMDEGSVSQAGTFYIDRNIGVRPRNEPVSMFHPCRSFRCENVGDDGTPTFALYWVSNRGKPYINGGYVGGHPTHYTELSYADALIKLVEICVELYTSSNK